MDQQQQSKQPLISWEQEQNMVQVQTQYMPGPNFQQQLQQPQIFSQQPNQNPKNHQIQYPVLLNQNQPLLSVQNQSLIEGQQQQDEIQTIISSWQGAFVVPKFTLHPNSFKKSLKFIVYQGDINGNKISEISFIKIMIPRKRFQHKCSCCNCGKCCPENGCCSSIVCLPCNLLRQCCNCRHNFHRLALYEVQSYNQQNVGYKKNKNFQIDLGVISGCCKENQISYLRPYGYLNQELGSIEKQNQCCDCFGQQIYKIYTGNNLQKHHTYDLTQDVNCFDCTEKNFQLNNIICNKQNEGQVIQTKKETDWSCDFFGFKLCTRNKKCYRIIFPQNMIPIDKVNLISSTIQLNLQNI